jgi:hypothetical protein
MERVPEQAFGSSPDALGIVLVKDLPDAYAAYRHRLLRLAYNFAKLDKDAQEKYVDAKSHYR